MNKKIIAMIIFCTLNWIFCIIGISIRHFTKVGWAITFSLQMACLLAIIIIAIINISQVRKKYRELLVRELSEDDKESALYKTFIDWHLENEE